MHRKIITTAFLFLTLTSHAQLPDDGFTMSRGELCLVAGYGQSKWSDYWEGTRLRDNKNIGTFTSKQVTPMLGIGLTDKLNFFAGLPHISNGSSAGWMMPMQGWQDLSVALKYQAAQRRTKRMTYTLFATVGASLPSNNYVPDFLPFSIGLGSKAASGRLVVHAARRGGLFFTAQSGYTFRSNITVDRGTYYTDGQYYSNKMAVPDVVDASLRAGIANNRLRAFGYYTLAHSTTGTDIRRNDMPYPGNQMNRQAVGFHTLVWVPGVKGLGLNASVEQSIAGRNVGKAFGWMAAVQYVFKPFSKTGHVHREQCTNTCNH